MNKHYDFVVFGGGSAGLTAAGMVAKRGLRTLLVDRAAVGGLCALNGCNPKKVLVRTTEIYDLIQKAAKFGIDVSPPKVNWSKVIDRKESFTNPVSQSTLEWVKKEKIDFLQGPSHFLAPNLIQADHQEVETRAALIATGSTPRKLTFPGADLVKTSDDILALREVPEKLAILGAGVVAFEFAQVFARLGSEVTLITPGQEALGHFDQALVKNVIDFSTQLGIRIRFGSRVETIRKGSQHGFLIEIKTDGKSQELSAHFVLNAAGRVASLEHLALEKANVEASEKGVVVNEYLRSPSNANVFAAGDVHGKMMLSPVASYEGSVAARNFLDGDKERVNYDSVPQILFTVPPLASVGLTEQEARKRGLDIAVMQHDMSEWKVYQIEGDPIAYSKIIVDSKSHKIIGAHLYGPNAGEEIQLFAMAIRFGIPTSDFKKMIFGYPVLSSALPYALS